MYSKSKDFWYNYEEKKIIGTGNFSTVYMAKEKESGKYVAIKEINVSKCDIKTKELKNKIKEMKKEENIINIHDTKFFQKENLFYSIMDISTFSLEDYLQIRENPLSIKEIKDILFQLNKSFEKFEDNKYHSCIKLSNILINLEEINKVVIKLCYFDSILFFNIKEKENKINLAKPPEVIKGEESNNKSDIWSLGIIIYYMLKKKYLYKGKSEYELIMKIESNKDNNQLCEDDELNDLLIKMLKINNQERISWEEYFNHPFFNNSINEKSNDSYNNDNKDNDNEKNNESYNNDNKDNDNEKNKDFISNNKIQIPKFNFICKSHSIEQNYYCKNCKKNICDKCLEKHPSNSHNVIPFYQIGLNNSELNTIESLLKSIDQNLKKLTKSRENIEFLINTIKLCKKNSSIYEEDKVNNFKDYYINCLQILCEKTKIEKDINILKIKENYILCEYQINSDQINQEFQILNNLDMETKMKLEEDSKKKGGNNYKREVNEDKINEELCDIFVNGKKIDFCFNYKFPKEKNKVKFQFKRSINNMCCMFNKCSKMTSIDLSKYNANNVHNIEAIFQECKELEEIDLSIFNFPYITNMSGIFNKCYKIKKLNLSQLNTINVNNMFAMFSDCSSLIELDLSNFNTQKVYNMSGMFNNCSSLTSLNLSNFNTKNVTTMYGMFNKCSSLKKLDLSSFDTSKVTDMGGMFNECSSLKNLDLSNFITDNVSIMNNLFCDCTSLMNINLSKFNCQKVKKMENIFLNLQDDCKLESKDENIIKAFQKKKKVNRLIFVQ